MSKPLFATENTRHPGKSVKEVRSKGKLKSEIAAEKRTKSIVSEIIGNTRMMQDPFIQAMKWTDSSKTMGRISGVKRKKPSDEDGQDMSAGTATETPPPAMTSKSLVNYDSD
jgi:hypothetical protein